MHILLQLVIFLLLRSLVELTHANRGMSFLAGWIAALIAYVLVDRLAARKSREIPNE